MATNGVNLDLYGENCKKIVLKYLETPKDVSLMGCDGKVMKTHAIVLSACSPYFDKALLNVPPNHDGKLILLLPSHKTVELQAVLNFIYHGTLSGDQVCIYCEIKL